MNTILQTFRDRLAAAGLVVETLEADGTLHRCGTIDKPRELDGAYKAHLDEPASLWWRNWRTGDEGTHTLKAEKEMSRAERKAYRERIEAARREAEAERAGRFAAAASRASQIWSLAPPATDAHAYLRRKGVLNFGLREAPDGRLIVPVLDAFDDRGQSLQYIAANGEKRFLSGGKTAGGCFAVRAKDNRVDGPLLICEGYATAASLRMATGHAVVMAFNAGNLESVARTMRQRFPKREIVLCADNDEGGERPDGAPFNPGVEAARKAAAAVGGKLAICPLIEGRKTDFNDLHLARGVDAVREAVEAARTANGMPDGFFISEAGRKAGLYKINAEGEPVYLGPPLFVRGLTRDSDGNNWGRLLEWHDKDGRLRRWAMPDAMLYRQGGEWFSELAAAGWSGVPSMRVRIAAYLSSVSHERRFRCVERVGWFRDAFVLPDGATGRSGGEELLFQSATVTTDLYGTAGTLDGWKEAAALSVGNSRLTFALCLAFAGPLLRLTGTEGGGFSLEGDSSCGKTTALQLAASVWGGPAHVRTWRATDNGLEGVAALHNDGLLILDEIGQVGGRVLSEAAYMLANGSGKTRAGKENPLRRSLTWRLLFLSSGEVGLADKLNECGLRSRAGQEVRLVGVPVHKEHATDLHGMSDAGALSDRLKAVAAAHHGHAGRAFLQWLTRDVDASRREALALVERWTASLLTACPDADGQVKRVARRFALCAAAGVLARDRAGILPEAMDAGMAVTACFRSWLEERGGAGASEDAAILAQARLFIEQHGASRFQDLDTQQASCVNRVGFRKKGDDGRTEYLILPESFISEVVRGFSERRAARVLLDAGLLKLSQIGRLKAERRLPELGKMRVYVLSFPDDGKR